MKRQDIHKVPIQAIAFAIATTCGWPAFVLASDTNQQPLSPEKEVKERGLQPTISSGRPPVPPQHTPAVTQKKKSQTLQDRVKQFDKVTQDKQVTPDEPKQLH